MKDPLQTEFNMSLETLKRIDRLIKDAHIAARGILTHIDGDFFYIDTLDRIYIEAQTKFDDKEREKCEEFQKKIQDVRVKWGGDMYKKYINTSARRTNTKYFSARGELKSTVRDYDIYLMRCMSIHNMLLKDKDSVEKYL